MKKIALLVICLIVGGVSLNARERKVADDNIEPMVIEQLVIQAKKNSNWKMAVATGKYEQVVFMNISQATNPKNEIGPEVHPFDQVILIAKGKANAVLNGKTSTVKEGDMIFVPTGTPHNVINLDAKEDLKIISFYSATDIPKNVVYKTKASEPKE